ncbi:uncharacterized protein EI90DRAFT_2084341 [Cantharellus anzutake]|uniref:uncharacterized protein n=1 Tax=Cantharellus anzutake TaxID=1750568 RepID=UPI001907E86D|nr:uncharacterized protein EI90DRAFT_2084341 [Cantharellus anzutake]KAF8340579.1 hypothetical protein EI90DRAFT_2084341 [Cantharellus anzutake]
MDETPTGWTSSMHIFSRYVSSERSVKDECCLSPTLSAATIVHSTELSIEYEDGDVILRTDDTDFRVHKTVLRLASPFFRSLFTLPQPPSTPEEIPIIPMEEDAEVLHTLISIIYPIRYKLIIDNLGFATRLLRAADKLEIECAIDLIRDSITPLLESVPNPLRAWALAKYMGHEVGEKAAVLRYIKCESSALLRERFTELGYVNALDYFDLVLKRQDALREAETAINKTVWGCSKCGGCPAWRSHYDNAIAGLNPFNDCVASDDLFSLAASASGCALCVDSVRKRNSLATTKTPSSLRAQLRTILSKYSS